MSVISFSNFFIKFVAYIHIIYSFVPDYDIEYKKRKLKSNCLKIYQTKEKEMATYRHVFIQSCNLKTVRTIGRHILSRPLKNSMSICHEHSLYSCILLIFTLCNFAIAAN